MSDLGPENNENLSGVWHGMYSYPVRFKMPESHFTAIVSDTLGLLSGSIQEEMRHGDGTHTSAAAVVDGQNGGGIVSFIKVYDGTNGLPYSVHYEGHLAADGNEIEGHWHVSHTDFVFSGRFLMIRLNGEKGETAIAAFEPVHI